MAREQLEQAALTAEAPPSGGDQACGGAAVVALETRGEVAPQLGAALGVGNRRSGPLAVDEMRPS